MRFLTARRCKLHTDLLLIEIIVYNKGFMISRLFLVFLFRQAGWGLGIVISGDDWLN